MAHALISAENVKMSGGRLRRRISSKAPKASAMCARADSRDAAAAAAQRLAERARAARDERVEGVRVRLQAERVHAPAVRRRG